MKRGGYGMEIPAQTQVNTKEDYKMSKKNTINNKGRKGGSGRCEHRPAKDRPRYFRYPEENTQASPVRITSADGKTKTAPAYKKGELARIVNGSQSQYRDRGHVLRPKDRRRTRKIREEEKKRRQEEASQEEGQE